MPAGYFFSSQQNPAKMPLLGKIWRVIRKHKIAVCFGIDTGQKPLDSGNAIEKYRLPSHGFAWTPVDGRSGAWRQRSSNNQNHKYLKPVLAAEDRSIREGGQRVEIMMRGELFNPSLRNEVQARGVRIVVDFVHKGKGFRFAGAARRWSSTHPIKAILMSSHTERKNATKC
jgi:hypothetical protein